MRSATQSINTFHSVLSRDSSARSISAKAIILAMLGNLDKPFAKEQSQYFGMAEDLDVEALLEAPYNKSIS
ncbi:unnamed protein product [Leptidea sinapis]|uniref:Uncharacterized protein n=1 Tax=Leptidea sinapis TaxID=189913 RepID=A0A5E4R3K9_9NEOP|nr:unnamed protein product [Leptidea sinapis]